MAKSSGAITLRVLQAVFKADTKQFNRAMKDAKRSFRNFTSGITSVARSALRFGSILTGVGVGGIAIYIRQQAQAIDATAKLADRLGTGTEKLVGFQHAAQIGGASVEEANKGLELFARRIGEVKDGTGEAKLQFEKLGLDADKLANMDLIDALGQAADAMNGMKTQSEKAAFAAQVFGRSGVRLMNTLAGGTKGLREMEAETKKLGLTFSRDQARQVEMANDALTRMQGAITGIARQLTIGLAPVIAGAADMFTDWATKSDDLGDRIISMVEDVTAAIVGAIARIKTIADQPIRGLWNEAKDIVTQGAENFLSSGMVPPKMRWTAADREYFRKALEGSQFDLGRVTPGDAAAMAAQAKVRAWFSDFRNRAANSTSGGGGGLGGNLQSAARQASQLGTIFGGITNAIDLATIRTGQWADALSRVADIAANTILQNLIQGGLHSAFPKLVGAAVPFVPTPASVDQGRQR